MVLHILFSDIQQPSWNREFIKKLGPVHITHEIEDKFNLEDIELDKESLLTGFSRDEQAIGTATERVGEDFSSANQYLTELEGIRSDVSDLNYTSGLQDINRSIDTQQTGMATNLRGEELDVYKQAQSDALPPGSIGGYY